MSKQRYRARKKDAYVADVSPSRIYERDGWRCQLCRRKVQRDETAPHPLAPVLDHIIPLAAGVAKGGVHAPHNVQCAHFLCNSIKRDRIDVAVQLALM
ncbi:HNH endonuclease [Micromonospora parva]|uniref:HNH endonuclease n=1 Tax=Micromonospora parva TaxID=1464048 RepID=UPI0033C7E986